MLHLVGKVTGPLIRRRLTSITVVLVVVVLVAFFPTRKAGAAAMLAPGVNGSLELVAQDAALDLVDGLAFDAFGNLFAALEIRGSSGGVVWIDKATGDVATLVTGISRADQIDIHPSGDFYVTSEVVPESVTDRLYRVAVTYDASNRPESAVAQSVTTSLAIDNPEGIVVLEADSAFGQVGDIYVAEDTRSVVSIPATHPGRIFKNQLTSPIDAVTTVLVDTDADLRRPEGMAFGNFSGALSDAIYVAETTDDNVLRIDADGSVTVVGDPTQVGLNNPDNVEFGPDGFLYVTEDVASTGRIIRVAPDGEHTVFAIGFDAPQGLAFDPINGDLYISEQLENRVWRVQFDSVSGDANGDGVVDAQDLNTVALNWQQSVMGGASDGDFDDNGFVDAADLNLLALNWQHGVDPQMLIDFHAATGVAVIPEPGCGAAVTVLWMGAGLLARRKNWLAYRLLESFPYGDTADRP